MTIERTTLPRQWALLKALPVYPRKISIRQLWNAMDQLGYEVTKRTIERDLINLSQQFGIVSDEAKPAGWSVMANDHATSRTADLLQPIMKPVLAPMAEEQNPKDEPEQDSEALDEWIQSLDPQGLLRLPQHHPEDFIGREWLLNRIDTWLETEHSKLLWLHGAPGMGKTALISRLANSRKEDVLATFYCQFSYQQSAEMMARKAILSWVLQLAQRLPEYRQQLMHQQALDSVSIEQHSALALFQSLIAQPLTGMPRPKSLNKAGKRALIIVDGLDEMAKTGERNPLLDLILDNADSLPDYLAILLSSRHEGDLRYRMAGVEAIEIVAESLENQNDLCL